MQHFYQHIPGWFDFQNHYTLMVNRATNGDHFVEVGSWLGRSAAYMAVEIARSGKQIQFDCVDTWLGSQVRAEKRHPMVRDNTLYYRFLQNMQPALDYYKPMRMTSVEASSQYQDHSLGFVFIDADHDYDSVYADITAWLPKVRPGGWIGGHDYTWNEGIRRACKELLPNHIHDGSWSDQEQRYIPEKELEGVCWFYKKEK